MRRALVVGLAVLALAAVGVAVLVTVIDSGPDEFTEADAEAAVGAALERCRHPLSDARRIDCEAVVNGFACRADGRFVAGFREPDPEQPQFRVMC
jgi:hypothetical protein